MNLRKIIDIVCAEVDDTIDDDLFVGWVHQAQVNIAREYGKVVQWEVYSEKFEYEEPLPPDFLKLVEVLDSEGEEVKDFTITSYGNIRFRDEGLYYVNYHAVPEAPPDSEDSFFDEWEPEVHSIFHPAIVLWCKAEYWDLESDADREESSFSDKFRQRFYHERSEGAKLLREREYIPKDIEVRDEWGY